MIEISNVNVCGWEAAIRGMRNPMNSWESSDSKFADEIGRDTRYYHDITGYTAGDDYRQPCDPAYIIGQDDRMLMRKLAAAGTDHAKFMRMITITADINAPLYWWKEFDTYKVGTVANSCSTMHKIAAKEFTLDDFSHEHLISDIPDGSKEYVTWDFDTFVAQDGLELIIALLNKYRELYLTTKDKRYWWQMIQLLPSSYNQRRTVLFNYAVLQNIYHSRRNHKLDEWRDFCKWIETLPLSELITGGAE